jgi:hypothetical protein
MFDRRYFYAAGRNSVKIYPPGLPKLTPQGAALD